jgi:hypothetical protein
MEKPCQQSRGYTGISRKMVRKVIITISRSSLNKGYLGSKTRSQSPYMEKPCLYFRDKCFDPNILKIDQTGWFDDLNIGDLVSKSRSQRKFGKI